MTVHIASVKFLRSDCEYFQPERNKILKENYYCFYANHKYKEQLNINIFEGMHSDACL